MKAISKACLFIKENNYSQDAETVWKDFLLEAENRGDEIDPEQDDDEDLDV